MVRDGGRGVNRRLASDPIHRARHHPAGAGGDSDHGIACLATLDQQEESAKLSDVAKEHSQPFLVDPQDRRAVGGDALGPHTSQEFTLTIPGSSPLSVGS